MSKHEAKEPVEDLTIEVWLAALGFSLELQQELGPVKMSQVVRLNYAEPKRGQICHTHDFCDANILMDEVIKSICSMRKAGVHTPRYHNLWNAAWGLADKHDFQLDQLRAGLDARLSQEECYAHVPYAARMESAGYVTQFEVWMSLWDAQLALSLITPTNRIPWDLWKLPKKLNSTRALGSKVRSIRTMSVGCEFSLCVKAEITDAAYATNAEAMKEQIKKITKLTKADELHFTDVGVNRTQMRLWWD